MSTQIATGLASLGSNIGALELKSKKLFPKLFLTFLQFQEVL